MVDIIDKKTDGRSCRLVQTPTHCMYRQWKHSSVLFIYGMPSWSLVHIIQYDKANSIGPFIDNTFNDKVDFKGAKVVEDSANSL